PSWMCPFDGSDAERRVTTERRTKDSRAVPATRATQGGFDRRCITTRTGSVRTTYEPCAMRSPRRVYLRICGHPCIRGIVGAVTVSVLGLCERRFFADPRHELGQDGSTRVIDEHLVIADASHHASRGSDLLDDRQEGDRLRDP